MRPRNYKSVAFAPELVVSGTEVREVIGYPNYRVSDDGRVWSWFRGCYWKELKPRKSNGYWLVAITRDGDQRHRPVHHLVLEAFVGPRPPGMEACHFPERDTANNSLSNLRWDTREANLRDVEIHGTMSRGETNGMSKLHSSEIPGLRLRHQAGELIGSIARSRGVNQATIRQVITGKTWKHA